MESMVQRRMTMGWFRMDIKSMRRSLFVDENFLRAVQRLTRTFSRVTNSNRSSMIFEYAM
jgi:hypothetical protein